MEERQRPGRGLEEVSHFFLSSVQKKDTESKKASGKRAHILSIYHPGSNTIKSFFLSNLAIELARHRFSIYVWDFWNRQETSIISMVNRFVREQDTKYTVKLNGIADITLYTENCGQSHPAKNIINAGHLSDDESYVLINTKNNLESIYENATPCDFILLTKADERSLLQCYAYIKVILDKDYASRVYIVLDDIREEKQAYKTFSIFSQYIERKFSYIPDYLGCLTHDEHIYKSIKDGLPLVLSEEKSITKEKIILISDNLIRNSKTDPEY